MSDLQVLLDIALQLLVLELVSVVHLKELQLGAFLESDFVILRSVIWQPFHMLGFERQMSLIFCQDLPCLVVLFRVVVVRKFAIGRDFGHFRVFHPFLEPGVAILVD